MNHLHSFQYNPYHNLFFQTIHRSVQPKTYALNDQHRSEIVYVLLVIEVITIETIWYLHSFEHIPYHSLFGQTNHRLN